MKNTATTYKKISFNAMIDTPWGSFAINTEYPVLYVDAEPGELPMLYHDSNYGEYTHRIIKQPDGSYMFSA